jgi:ParB family chromosome partitioning protein
VRPDPQGERSYIIIGGERRFRAFERLGLSRIQAIIKRVDEKQARELALVDNLQRVDLSPLEEAAGYARLIEEFGLTQEDVAERVGKSRTYVTGALALNRLPDKVKQEARSASVSKSKLVELAQLGDQQRQLALWEKLKRGITVAEARQAKQRDAERPQSKPKLDKIKQQFPETLKAGRQFAQQLERVDPEYYRNRPKDFARVVELYDRLGKHLESVRQAMSEPAAENAPEADEMQESAA